MALRTITPQHGHLRQITIYLPYDSSLSGAGTDVRKTIGEQIFGQWLGLDRLLAQLWESRSIRPKTLFFALPGMGKDIIESVECLLLEVTGRGIIDLVQWVF